MAAACPAAERDWIEVQFDTLQPVGAPDDAGQLLQQRVLKHLQAEFRTRGIDVCISNAPSARASLATLRIGRDDANSAVVKAWANDAVTEKELSRRLSLEGLPEDAHAMAIALGASELLEASWVELRLVARPRTKTNVPQSVQQLIDEREPDRPRFGDLAIVSAGEAFFGGVKQFGLDAQLALALARDLDAVARIGGRSSLSARSPHGSIAADGWLIGAGADYVIARPAPRLRLTMQGRCDVMWLTFTAIARKGATATSAAGNTWWLSAGLGLDARVAQRVALDVGFLAGRVMLPLSATDDGVKIMGITKGLVAGHAGIKILF